MKLEYRPGYQPPESEQKPLPAPVRRATLNSPFHLAGDNVLTNLVMYLSTVSHLAVAVIAVPRIASAITRCTA
jgi:hypothetical protein